MLYKTIRAVRFYTTLFDLDTGKYYRLVTAYLVCKSGYFLIIPCEDDKWLVRKCFSMHISDDYNQLPYLVRLRLHQFLIQKYGMLSSIQKILENIDL